MPLSVVSCYVPCQSQFSSPIKIKRRSFCPQTPATNTFVEDFFEAVRDNDVTEVRRLLEDGVDVDVRDGDDDTGLMTSCRHGNDDVARELLAWGADVDATECIDEDSALTLAAKSCNSRLLELMLKVGLRF